jgi:molybdate transport system substrate-binding protein
MTMRWFLALAIMAGVSMRPAWAETRGLTIAAASDLQYCLEDLHQAFGKVHPGIRITTTTGSSGNFFAQISHGAPFDVYLAADVAYPRKLIASGGAVADSLTPYAVGRIAVWTLDPAIRVADGISCLADPAVRRVAIADPSHAPYGRAAKQALIHAGIWSKVEPKLVMGENISQTAQFIQSGNAQAGIVALSLLLSPKLRDKGHYALVPFAHFERMLQAAVITRFGATNPAARTYMTFLKDKTARAIFNRYGFLLPEEGR